MINVSVNITSKIIATVQFMSIVVNAADGTVENSNQTYSVAVPPASTLILPDVQHTDSNGQAVILPAVIPMVCTPAVIPVGITYPHQLWDGQKISYRDGDSGYRFINGFYTVVDPPNPTHTATLDFDSVSPFLTLKYNNIHGNRQRFTDRNGSQVYGDLIQQDHFRGREWQMSVGGNTSWNSSIDSAFALVLGGDSDWFLANIKEQSSLVDLNLSDTMNYFPTSSWRLVVSGIAHSGTTNQTDTTRSYTTHGNTNASHGWNVARNLKTTSYRRMVCRIFI